MTSVTMTSTYEVNLYQEDHRSLHRNASSAYPRDVSVQSLQPHCFTLPQPQPCKICAAIQGSAAGGARESLSASTSQPHHHHVFRPAHPRSSRRHRRTVETREAIRHHSPYCLLYRLCTRRKPVQLAIKMVHLWCTGTHLLHTARRVKRYTNISFCAAFSFY